MSDEEGSQNNKKGEGKRENKKAKEKKKANHVGFGALHPETRPTKSPGKVPEGQ